DQGEIGVGAGRTELCAELVVIQRPAARAIACTGAVVPVHPHRTGFGRGRNAMRRGQQVVAKVARYVGDKGAGADEDAVETLELVVRERAALVGVRLAERTHDVDIAASGRARAGGLREVLAPEPVAKAGADA